MFVSYVTSIIKLAFQLCFECQENITFSCGTLCRTSPLGCTSQKLQPQNASLTCPSVRVYSECVMWVSSQQWNRRKGSKAAVLWSIQEKPALMEPRKRKPSLVSWPQSLGSTLAVICLQDLGSEMIVLHYTESLHLDIGLKRSSQSCLLSFSIL